jgi:hypothetical protein
MICGLNKMIPGSCKQPARGVYPCGGRTDDDPLCELHAALAKARDVGDEVGERRAAARLRGGGDYVPERRPESSGMYPAMQKGER